MNLYLLLQTLTYEPVKKYMAVVLDFLHEHGSPLLLHVTSESKDLDSNKDRWKLQFKWYNRQGTQHKESSSWIKASDIDKVFIIITNTAVPRKMHVVFCRCCEGLESDYPYRFLYLHTPSVTTTDFEGESDRCLLSGAVSLCSPFNVALTDDDMNKVFNKVYINGLGTSQSKVFRRPLLCIQAANDPFAPVRGIPHQNIQ
ncbi:hypothetical protein Tco_0618396, partial [Tanacetum coccineum]